MRFCFGKHREMCTFSVGIVLADIDLQKEKSRNSNSRAYGSGCRIYTTVFANLTRPSFRPGRPEKEYTVKTAGQKKYRILPGDKEDYDPILKGQRV